jgi:hypothetical protein
MSLAGLLRPIGATQAAIGNNAAPETIHRLQIEKDAAVIGNEREQRVQRTGLVGNLG